MSQAKPNFTRLELGLNLAWVEYVRLKLSLFKSMLKYVSNQLIILKPSEILTKKRNV